MQRLRRMHQVINVKLHNSLRIFYPVYSTCAVVQIDLRRRRQFGLRCQKVIK